jgi:hypothetical protein
MESRFAFMCCSKWNHGNTTALALKAEKENTTAQKEVEELRRCNGPLKRMHTGDLDITGCVSLVIQVMAQVV